MGAKQSNLLSTTTVPSSPPATAKLLDPREPTQGLRRSTLVPANGAAAIAAMVENDSIEFPGMQRTASQLLDPRSPTMGVARTPIPIEIGQSILDPRSPTMGISRTPIPSCYGIQDGMVLDPRSPTIGIARTPLRKSGEQSPLDPRSPTMGLARTPLHSLADIAPMPTFPSLSNTRVEHVAGAGANPPPLWNASGSMISIMEADESSDTMSTSPPTAATMDPRSPGQRRLSFGLSGQPQPGFDPREPTGGIRRSSLLPPSPTTQSQPTIDPREPTNGIKRPSLMSPNNLRRSSLSNVSSPGTPAVRRLSLGFNPVRSSISEVDESRHPDEAQENFGEGYIELGEGSGGNSLVFETNIDGVISLEQPKVHEPFFKRESELTDSMDLAAQIIEEFSKQSAAAGEILGECSENLENFDNAMRQKTFSPTSRQKRRESQEEYRRQSSGGSPRRSSDAGVGYAAAERRKSFGSPIGQRRALGMINSPGSSTHNSRSASRRNSLATVFYNSPHNKSLPNIPIRGSKTSVTSGSDTKHLFSEERLNSNALRI